MPYSVFLVEDEIVAREGIRSNVDWMTCGFELCGEAADGELALPLLERLRPDLLITDIRMPFMDGLQLCRLVRERLPRTRIIIISGYDEFGYAQEAIKLGVTEYLLKPISAQDIAAALQRIRQAFDQDRAETQRRLQLEQQLSASRPLLQEHFLLELVLGKVETADALQRSREFGLEILAPRYRILVTHSEPLAGAHDFGALQAAEAALNAVAAGFPGVLSCHKDSEATLFIVKGETAEGVAQESERLSGALAEAGAALPVRIQIGMGTDETRLCELKRSFLAANARLGRRESTAPLAITDALPLIDHHAVEAFLTTGSSQQIDTFVEAQTEPWTATVTRSPLMRNYLLLDIYLTAGRLIEDWGSRLNSLFPEVTDFAVLAATIADFAGFQTQFRHVVATTIDYRNCSVDQHQTALVHTARAYIDAHYSSPELSLANVAHHVNLSPSHFSALFGRENGATFREYLTQVRIRHAQELLRGSSLRAFEIAEAVGYADPHYFSTVFKKETGRSPRAYRNER
jgi:two-component system response regulator YesN